MVGSAAAAAAVAAVAGKVLRWGGSALLGQRAASLAQPKAAAWASGLPSRRSSSARAVIRRRKDPELDKVVQVDKPLRLVVKLKELLLKQPERRMTLRDLGMHRRHLGLSGKRRCIALLRKFPAVFEVVDESHGYVWFTLSHEAEVLYQREQAIKRDMTSLLVDKVRKLLMMSAEKRILVEHLTHLRRDLGLFDDFRIEMVHQHPEFFEVVDTLDGPALELRKWDDRLAVTFWESRQSRSREAEVRLQEEALAMGFPGPKSLQLPKGLQLKRKDRESLQRFAEVPFVSPYSDASHHLDPTSPEAEKHNVAVIYEMLSFTLEKRLLVDHLTHFRKDFKLTQRIRSLLIRHPDLFYVSEKGTRDSVFLRDAYKGTVLKDEEKDPITLAMEELRHLVYAAQQSQRLNALTAAHDGWGEDDGAADDWEHRDDANDSLSTAMRLSRAPREQSETTERGDAERLPRVAKSQSSPIRIPGSLAGRAKVATVLEKDGTGPPKERW
eukprot:SM000099S25221  [mRNA]  locus=s99:199102:202852:- [translate_table: standard]